MTPTIHATGLGTRSAYHRWPLAPRPRQLTDWTWASEAECAKVDPEIFFPIGSISDPIKAADWTQARYTCARCPVSTECREWNDGIERGATTAYLYGMFAGETPLERTSRRRREKAAKRANA